MLTLGAIGFLQPLALGLLLALPVIWWLLRFTPPHPHAIAFPPFRLLLGLDRTEEEPDRSPWWLTALRILAALAIILAFARPVLNPAPDTGAGEGPLVIVVDNSWAAAPGWPARARLLAKLLDEAEDAGRIVAVVPTARGATADIRFAAAGDIRAAAGTLAPRPHAPLRMDVLDKLSASLLTNQMPDIVWLADGLDYGSGTHFGQQLAGLGRLTVFDGEGQPWIYPPRLEDGDLVVRLERRPGDGVSGEIAAVALNGRDLGREAFSFPDAETSTEVRFSLPVDLRNQVARLAIAGGRSAGSVALLDDRWRRRVVGLVSGASAQITQPLLAPLYYVERALAPFTELRPMATGTDNSIADLLAGGLSMLILADVGHLGEGDARALGAWIEKGGTLVRFAGPRLAAGAGELLPVDLRRGGRSLGGALSWAAPQALSPFQAESPFAGMDIPGEVTVTRQVLAEPGLELATRTWARLADGTPLVTAKRQGNGRIVLFHVTANTDWSNLPLSGLFVDMLRRLVELTEGVGSAAADAGGGAERLRPRLALDGFGRLLPPPGSAQPIPAAAFAETMPGPDHPPGYYGPEDGPRALNTLNAEARPLPLEIPAQAVRRAYEENREIPLARWLILAGFILLLIDLVATLALSGRLRSGRAGTAAALALAVAAAIVPDTGLAQGNENAKRDARALMAATQTRLAYVQTGDGEVDRISNAGLHSLSIELANRTALEPATPVGLNIEVDELVFFPLIYWPVLADAEPPSGQALAKIDTYLRNGGTILFDSRDPLGGLPGTDIVASPAASAMRRLLSGLDIPPLEPVPANHVLTKAFYLLQSFPGRFDGGELWVEASSVAAGDEEIEVTTRTNADGVSSVIIGANDYAGAWARDNRGAPMLPVSPGGQGQREMATRVGVNIVMYTLTGNYKADQVHVPALLERLGQ
ncbi:FIG003603: membrane protein, putative [hydrothermal vent metagenome]|uniref:FIG003603: membrane protein, putative n=1 Tax=hydrothermal vent metagenome TaxID=652676 RepID=A0A3B0TR97_9ZZZZ